MAVLISGIGFDEKFVVRAFLRRGINQVKEVLLVKPKGEEPRSQEALNSLRSLMSETSTPLQVLEVDHTDFPTAVSQVMHWIKGSRHTEFIVNLSSGMRVLILEILTAFLLLRIDAEVEVETESGEGVISWRTRDLMDQEIEETELRILALIQQGETSSLGISKRLKIPTSTVWRKMRRLQEAGFIEAEGREVRLTNKGRIFVKFFQNSRI